MPARLLMDGMLYYRVCCHSTRSDFVEARSKEEIRDIFASIGQSFSDDEFDRIYWRVRAALSRMGIGRRRYDRNGLVYAL